ncbi:MAG: histidine triad nucleotide-binding protein [Candidatus Marinimicrobia bacterium]|nr:histidine triad nucleotide-binding protein [Candidatus Neomarinimicrobiota bacterium]
MTGSESGCLFCKIVSEEIPADVLYKDETVVAFRDVNPQAPTHILIIPRQHIAYAADMNETHSDLLYNMFDTANSLASKEGIDAEGYRLVINNGRGAGQSVFHLHLHLLGGRPMHWPPG